MNLKNNTDWRKDIREPVYLTNLSVGQCSLEELVKFYEQRWQIEIQFRAIKQSTQMKKALGRITNRFHLQALVYAAMIFATLPVRVYRLIASPLTKPSRLNMERTANWLSQKSPSCAKLTKLSTTTCAIASTTDDAGKPSES